MDAERLGRMQKSMERTECGKKKRGDEEVEEHMEGDSVRVRASLALDDAPMDEASMVERMTQHMDERMDEQMDEQMDDGIVHERISGMHFS